jgi:hypothetical protein
LYLGLLEDYPSENNNRHEDRCFLSVSHTGWGYGVYDFIERPDLRQIPIDEVGSSINANGSIDTPFNFETLLSTKTDYEGTVTRNLIPGVSVMMNQPDDDGLSWSEKCHFLTQQNPRSPLFNSGLLSFANHQGYKIRFYDHGPAKPTGGGTSSNYELDEILEPRHPPFAIGYNKANGGTDQMILFEVPKSAPFSVGNLMHANLLNVERISLDLEGRFRCNYQTPQMSPAYAIGNSFSSINIFDLDQTKVDYRDNRYYNPTAKPDQDGAHYDYSYLLNDLLWDKFYFSSVDPREQYEEPLALPNSRIVPSSDSIAIDDLLEPNRSAANLMIRGGFNINSTSVPAWESVLGAMRGVEHLGEVQPDADAHNFTRLTAPVEAGAETPDYNADRESITSGYRTLSDAQITDLAEAIVHEIRVRRSHYGYPFTSLSEFINRSINPVDIADRGRRRFAYCGAVQQAIDQSSVNGQAGLDEDWERQNGGNGMWEPNYTYNSIPLNTGHYDAGALEVIKNRPFMEGIPGTIMQADVLAKIGALISPRSDTFTVRSYGDYTDPLRDTASSKAYCEIVVQRTPEYVDPFNEPTSGMLGLDGGVIEDDIVSETNRIFGRRFEIVSMRWLPEGEI